MVSIALTFTAAEHQGFQEALGDFGRASGGRIPVDAQVLLAAAGLRPATSLIAGFVHNLLTGSFGDPLPFDPAHHTQAAYAEEGPREARTPAQSPDVEVVLSIAPPTTDSLQFLLLCMFGPQMHPGAHDNDPPGLRAGKRLADAVAQAFPQSPSRLRPVTVAYTDGTEQKAGV